MVTSTLSQHQFLESMGGWFNRTKGHLWSMGEAWGWGTSEEQAWPSYRGRCDGCNDGEKKCSSTGHSGQERGWKGTWHGCCIGDEDWRDWHAKDAQSSHRGCHWNKQENFRYHCTCKSIRIKVLDSYSVFLCTALQYSSTLLTIQRWKVSWIFHWSPTTSRRQAEGNSKAERSWKNAGNGTCQ